ncbi:MAG: FkbM family methyltransferase [Phycisphaera sp. RhM]|nr:FkbM family methyltransferase [Phycisphaera sp. RhM]
MRHLIKSAFSLFGLEIRLVKNIARARAKQKHDDLVQRWRLLQRYQPETILDIGANTGQCAALLREAFPGTAIYSFEPLSDCFQQVDRFLNENGPGKAYPFALGEFDGEETINRNRFTPSSSILPMQDLHRTEFPQTVESSPETIQIRRLDNLADELNLNVPFVIKADVQGYEDRVIRGGIETFRKASAVVLELSTYRLYEGQALFPEILEQLAELGFAFRGVIDQTPSSIDGRILQFDGLFENENVACDTADELQEAVGEG